MNKKLFITIALTLASPLLANAQTSVLQSATTSIQATTTLVTEAQILTACAQSSIDIRDSAISSARTAYNNAMTVALDARKDAEKKAVAIEDADQKKDAIKVAVDAYKKDVTQAQDLLTKARKDAWAQFETNTNDCRDISKEKPAAANMKTTGEARMMMASPKAQAVEQKVESKTFKETIKEQISSIKAFFKIGSDN